MIIDELGRGTSTYDGYSLANAVLTRLVTTIKCRTLFTTHYGWLAKDFQGTCWEKMISCYHMLIKVVNLPK